MNDEIFRGSKAEAIDDHIRSMQKEAFFSGAVLIVNKGDIILSKGYGHANSSTKNSPLTIFQIGSLTKQFTAAAILELCASGKINLEDPINQCLREDYTSNLWRNIKICHLLSHTSGIKNYTDSEDYYRICKTITVEKIIKRAKHEDLSFRPGSDYQYSNTGYILLGLIIETQSDMSYSAFIKKTLLEPSGMSSSGVFDEHYRPLSTAAMGYCLDKSGQSLIEDHSENISGTFSDGSIYSNVYDLEKWSQVLDGKKGVLHKKTIELMLKSGLGGYGYGLEIGKIFDHIWVHHSGSIAGFNADFCKFPEKGIFIAVLANNFNFDTQHMSGEISKFLLENSKIPAVVSFPRDFDYESYLGNFASEDDEYEFYLKNNRIFLDGSPPTECLFLSNNNIYNPALGLEFMLKRGDKLGVYDGYGIEIDSLSYVNYI